MRNCYPLKTTEPFERGGSVPSNTLQLHHYKTYTPSQKSTTHTSDFPKTQCQRNLLGKSARIDELKLCGSNGRKTTPINCEPEVSRPNSRRSTRRSTSMPRKRGCIQKVTCKRRKEPASGRGRPKRARPSLRQRSPLTSPREDSNPPPAVDANGLEGLNAYQSLVKRKDQIVCPKFKRIPALLDCDEWDSSDSNEDLNDEVFLRMNLKEEMRQKLYYSRLQDVRQKEEAHRSDPSIVVPPRPTGTNAVVLSKSQAELEPVIPKGFGRLPTFNYTLPINPADWRNPPRLIRVESYGTGPISSKPQTSYGGKSCTWAKKGSDKSRSGKGNGGHNTSNLPAIPPSAPPTTVSKSPTGSKHPLEIIAKEQQSNEYLPKRLAVNQRPLSEPLPKRSNEQQLDDSLFKQPMLQQSRLGDPKRPKRLLLRLRRRAS